MKKIFIIFIVLLAAFFLLREKGNGPNVSQNGISTNQLTEDILLKYDVSKDGKLSVSNESFKRTESNGVVHTESRGPLFTDADGLGNKDGEVSKLELMDFLSEFDENGDGEITTYQNIFKSLFGGKSEWWKLENRYGEKFKYEKK